jgi:flagellar hook-associated protein 2
MTISSPGIGSSLDVNSIVSQLMAVESKPLTAIGTKTTAVQAKISALGAIKSSLSSFQSTISGMASASILQPLTGVSSDTASATMTLGAGAVAANYSLSVSQLAQQQKLASAGQVSTQSQIGSGTLTFDFGTVAGSTVDANGKYTGASFTSTGAGARSVVIDPSNTSLSGIRDAINKAGIGVTASIVNDGSNTPYRLVLTDTASGKANSMKISVTGDAALSQLLSHDPASLTTAGQAMSETQTARDSVFTIDGIQMSKSTNTVTDAMDGVTLNLLKPTTTPVVLSMSSNTAFITTAITKFVSAYNQLNQTLKASSVYNPTTKVAAILNGDPAVKAIQSQLRAVMSSPIQGGASTTALLSQVGVTMQKDGTLAVDNAKLTAAVDRDATAVTGLFAAVGSSTDRQVAFTSASNKTSPGAYAIAVSKLATKATYSSNEPSGLTVTAGSNSSMQITLNGVVGNISLTPGTYTTASLASEIQAKVNGNAAFSAAGVSVSVSTSGASGDSLSIESNNFGSASSIAFTDSPGSDLAYFFGASPTVASGTDVVGTINGVAAGGSGQFMSGAAGSAAEGLKMQVLGGLVPSDRGTVNYTQGYAYQLNALLTKALDSTGSIDSETSGLTSSVTRFGKDSDALTIRLAALEARYRKQFTALDTLMSSMTTTSSYLTQQLAAIAKNS